MHCLRALLYFFVAVMWAFPLHGEKDLILRDLDDDTSRYNTRVIVFMKTMQRRIEFSRTINLFVPKSERYILNGAFLRWMSESYLGAIRIYTYSRDHVNFKTGRYNLLLLQTPDHFP